jgi:uncharacterized membrane-anchored protein YhcB (DUF1043 family)
MMILWIVLAFLAGCICGLCILSFLNFKRANKLERYQRELDAYRAELDREKYWHDAEWEFPKNKDGGGSEIIINK